MRVKDSRRQANRLSVPVCSGRCHKYKGKIDSKVISMLQKTANKKHLLKGSFSLDPLPIACIKVMDKRQFTQLKRNIECMFLHLWPSVFGSVTSFSAQVGRGIKQVPLARIFVPTDELFAQTVDEQRRLVFFIYFKGKRTDLYEVKFSNEFGNSQSLNKKWWQEEVIYRDNELAFWWIQSQADDWRELLTPLDEIHMNWAESSYKHFIFIYKNIIKGGWFTEDAPRPKMINSEDMECLKEEAPYAYSIFQELLTEKTSIDNIMRLMKKMLTSDDCIEILYNTIINVEDTKINLFSDKYGLFAIFNKFFLAFQMCSEATKAGTRRLWIDGTIIPMKIEYIDLDRIQIGTKCDYYWNELDQYCMPFDIGKVLTSKDIPMKSLEIWQALEDMRLDCSQEEAMSAYYSLMMDIEDNVQWSIPWGARVNININGFPFVELYQMEHEILFLLRNEKDNYFCVSISPKTRKFNIYTLLRNLTVTEDVENNDEATHALLLLLTSVVRDFVVVEKRELIFTAKSTRNRNTKNKDRGDGFNVVYLPRIQYKNCNPHRYMSDLPHSQDRARHDVRPHFRKANNPSKEQLWLAQNRYQMTVPRGYTFVRPHARGDSDIKKKTIYRSHSASSLIYTSVDGITGNTPEWFKFERAVAKLLKAKGFNICHMSPKINVDGGVTIYAYDRSLEETWVILCICSPIDKKVGPNVIRDLYSSLDKHPKGTKGMVVTTSFFTSSAEEVARKTGITLCDNPFT